MQILKKLTQNNYNEVAKMIQKSSLSQQCLTGVIKNELKKYRQSYSIPARIQLAKEHQQAIKYGFKPALKGSQQQVCSCCNIRIQNQDIPLCYSIQPNQNKYNKQQFKLTQDVALFFTFIKSLILLLLINSLIHGVFNLYSSQFLGGYCEMITNCNKDFWNTLSISNKIDKQNLVFIVDVLNLVAIVFSIIFFMINRRRLYKLSQKIQASNQNQSNYTILVSNIPIIQFPKKNNSSKNQLFYRKNLQMYFQQIIKNWLKSKNQWQSKKDTNGKKLLELINKNNGQLRSEQIVKSVSLCYNLSRLQVLQDVKHNLLKDYQQQIDQSTSLVINQSNHAQSQYSGRFISIPQRVNFLNDCQLILNGQFARDNSFLFNVTHFVGHAFISFQYCHYKAHIQQLFNNNSKQFYYNGNYLKISQSSYPSDIYWQNMKISQLKQRKKTFTSYFILSFMLIFSFIVLLFLQLWKLNNSKSQNGDMINIAKSYSLNLVIAIIIIGVNYGLDLLCKYLTDGEKRKTRSDFVYSLFIKSFITKLINTIILYFLISLILSNQLNNQKFMGNTGLIFQISTLMILICVLKLIYSLILPEQLWFRFKRWLKYRKTPTTVQNKFQISLNHEFQFPQFNMTTKYSDYLVTLYTAFFYSYLIPVTLILLIIIFFLQYWIDKYTLFRRSSLRFHYDFNLLFKIYKFFECSIIALGLGNILFSLYVKNQGISILNLVGLLITLIFVILVFLAPRKFQTLIFGSSNYNQKYTYDDCLYDGKFESTYWTQNPATFLVEEEKVTGKKKPVNPALYRQSKQGGMFISSFNS